MKTSRVCLLSALAASLAACGDFDAAVTTYCANHPGTGGCDGGNATDSGSGGSGGGTGGGTGGGVGGGTGGGGGGGTGGGLGGGTGGAAGGGTSDSGLDAGEDAGQPDAGTSDAGALDAGAPDAGTDAGMSDAGLAWELALGDEHTCARELSSGLLRCFGHNQRRQLGGQFVGAVVDTPSTPPSLPPADALSAGGAHTCVLIDGGGVCFGMNTNGALGHPGSEPAVAPIGVTTIDAGIRQLTCGGRYENDFSCARTETNEVWCWGYNVEGQLGSMGATGSTALRVTGVIASQLSSFGNTSCAILTDAGLTCWGANDTGQLGQGTTLTITGPVLVPIGAAVTRIAVGVTHACALTSTGTVLCWGSPLDNRNGHDGGIGPAPVIGLASAREISAGGTNSCAILLNGQVRCWGINDFAELGSPSTSAKGPVAVPLPAPALQVATGGLHSCASLSNGEVWCWGYNGSGQVGQQNGLAQLPRKVPGL